MSGNKEVGEKKMDAFAINRQYLVLLDDLWLGGRAVMKGICLMYVVDSKYKKENLNKGAKHKKILWWRAIKNKI